MQYIVFSIQAGLDSVELNALLEQANDMTPADGTSKRFTYRRYRDPISNEVIFGPPQWVHPIPFYSNSRLEDDLDQYVANPVYKRIIDSGKNTVIPINLTYFTNLLPYLSFKEYLEKDVCAIYVYSNDRVRLYNEAGKGPFKDNSLQVARDNILNVNPLDQELMTALYPAGFDAIIEMDRIWSDWDYLNNILTGIGINLPKSKYDEYLQISGRG
jgi:hypothetical protein